MCLLGLILTSYEVRSMPVMALAISSGVAIVTTLVLATAAAAAVGASRKPAAARVPANKLSGLSTRPSAFAGE